jgi:hypothetical protein
MIRDACGKPYQLSGSLQMFDQNNPDLAMLHSINAELYRIYGSPALFFPILINVDNVDKLWIEDRTKLWAPGIEIFVLYTPLPAVFQQGQFGIDGPMDLVLETHNQSLIAALGQAPRIGSKIFLPLKREWFVLTAAQNENFALWNQFGINLICQRFQETVTDASGSPSLANQTTTTFNID